MLPFPVGAKNGTTARRTEFVCASLTLIANNASATANNFQNKK
jgi:hypothetical protein